ncbi:phage tail assembly chaperone [Sphingomonas sp. BK235]|uniref:phage tail assembly chaperone n=1 Tax=Sphingomonas sp. BK235 TaxID=2512131 RepID=UPI0010535318|nr:phage tail assembly chaperone [Sphingomonas sp. BK235]TCP33609.1 tail assembly chaperone [Sphingomonas sp. BK235]
MSAAPPPAVPEAACFAAAATRLAGLATLALGWRPDDFWRATPAELAALGAALAPGDAPPPDAALRRRLQEMFPDG